MEVQSYTERKLPKSRPLEEIKSGQARNANQSPLQMNFFFSYFGNLLRRLGMGKWKMAWGSVTDPDAYELSQVFQLLAKS